MNALASSAVMGFFCRAALAHAPRSGSGTGRVAGAALPLAASEMPGSRTDASRRIEYFMVFGQGDADTMQIHRRRVGVRDTWPWYGADVVGAYGICPIRRNHRIE